MDAAFATLVEHPPTHPNHPATDLHTVHISRFAHQEAAAAQIDGRARKNLRENYWEAFLRGTTTYMANAALAATPKQLRSL